MAGVLFDGEFLRDSIERWGFGVTGETVSAWLCEGWLCLLLWLLWAWCLVGAWEFGERLGAGEAPR